MTAPLPPSPRGFAESGLSPVVVQGPQPSCPYGSAVTTQREKPGSLPLATKPKTSLSRLRCAEAVVGAPGVMNPPSSAVPGLQLDSNWRSAPVLGADSLQGLRGGRGKLFPPQPYLCGAVPTSGGRMSRHRGAAVVLRARGR